MINFRWPLKKRNEGASLAAVVITIMFVMTMGVIVLTVTTTNIRMREVEEAGKKNFYGADGVMDEIASGLNDIASDAMQAAYTQMLTDYRSYMLGGVDIQKKFGYLYVEKLQEKFMDNSVTPFENKITTPTGIELIYVYGNYRTAVITDVMSTENKPYFQPIAATTFSADYEDGIFTLHNLRVVYTDTNGYETVISTDIVFHTPELTLGDNESMKEFMKYALIADRKIEVIGSNTTVNGSMYAGYDGITVNGGSVHDVNLVGKTIVTRGDINVNSGSSDITVGTDHGAVWAENVTTTKVADPLTNVASPSSLLLKGNLYISDDLTLDAPGSSVKLEGNYYGYNFLKTYDGSTATGSQYSSAIVINGKNANLNMEDLNYLMLAGRTYIARGSNDPAVPDVVLGESLSVRTNQLAYYVPERFLDDAPGGKTLSSKLDEYERYIKMTDVMDYLNPTEPVLAYRFRDSNSSGGVNYLYRYYLNFKSEQAANDFFVAFSTANEARLNNLGDEYADAIIIGNGVIMTFKGDVMTRASAAADFEVKETTIIGDAWAPDTGAFYIYARQMARDYKSLQLYLEPWNMHSADAQVSDANVRFADKKDDPVTDYFIRFSDIAPGSVTVETDGSRLIAVVGNDPASSSDVYIVGDAYTEGIVIATGNVKVTKSFKGLIIAGGDIQLFSNNVTIDSDEMLISEMFKDDAERPAPIFSHLFPGYGHSVDNTIGLINIDKYQTYENWTRTEN